MAQGTSQPGGYAAWWGKGDGVGRHKTEAARFRRPQKGAHPIRIPGKGARAAVLTHRQPQNVVGGGQGKAEPLGVVVHGLEDG